MTHRGPDVRDILLVEDNPLDAELIIDLLTEPGSEERAFTHVVTLGEAVAALEARGFDAILLDLRLPDACGLECVTTLLGVRRDTAIVVLSGAEEEHLALACIDAGAQDYLVKREILHENVRRALRYAVVRVRERSAREQANELRERLAAIVDASGDAITGSSATGLVTSWNRAAESAFGLPAAQAIGRPIGAVIGEWGGRDADIAQEAILTAALDAPGNPSEGDVWGGRGARVVLSVKASAVLDPAGGPIGVAAIWRDITEARRRDEELAHRNAELCLHDMQMRALAARLTATREEERTRISREVHDELGQLLTAIRMDLHWIARHLPDDPRTAGPIGHRLDEASGLVVCAIETVQRIAVDLRPSALDALGLPPAVRDEGVRFETRTGVRTTTHVPASIETDPEISTALFRILQEMLANVARHAEASAVRVDLVETPESWTLRVEDDGVGLDVSVLGLPTSLGLLGMRERAAELGGSFSLTPRIGGGTAASVRIPRGHQAP